MQPDFKFWNAQQKALRPLLNKTATHELGIAAFLDHHTMLHTSAVADSAHGSFANLRGSFADLLWQDLTAEQARYLPPNGEHTIIWCLWHSARIEDVTMNMLLAGRPQVWQDEAWSERLHPTNPDTANATTPAEVAALSASLDLDGLREYRAAVGRRTRENVQALEPGDLQQKVNPERIAAVRAAGVVAEEAHEIINYWSKRTLAGLLLMPATRHNMVHLNEALRLKDKKRR